MKLIAIDMDGTLLNPEQIVSRKNRQAIQEAQSRGIKVVIATGRAHFDAQMFLEEAGLALPIIGANGATLHDKEGRRQLSVPMAEHQAYDILAWLEENEYYYEVFTNRAIFTPHHGRDLLSIELDRLESANPETDRKALERASKRQFNQSGYAFISSAADIKKEEVEIYNILAFSFLKEKRDRGWAQFQREEQLTLVSSGDHNFELEHLHASKGQMLKYLADMEGISLEDAAAIGDSFNDLSMMNAVGCSAAMGNARDEIKRQCSITAPSNADDGVAAVITQMLEQHV
ncbi:Cof-type HAD-IIB family hydrolase [Salibacterium aidingense]|uniref:Cof-type HAD-IIB family hydrolase n=1 Tax=Salibacterium aidingense TaxID=384933 RepID=UPI003BECC11C